MDEKFEVIPPISKLPKTVPVDLDKRTYLWCLVVLFIAFISLLIVITYLPMGSFLRGVSLVFGSFLILDIHRSIKAKIYGKGSR